MALRSCCFVVLLLLGMLAPPGAAQGGMAAPGGPSVAGAASLRQAAVDALQLQSTLTDPHGQAADYFGYGVALSADGTTGIVSAVGWNGFQAAYVFVRDGAQWTEQAMLTPTDSRCTGGFGRAVALSDDGNTALVGAPDDTGCAYVFVRSGTAWREQDLLPDDGPGGTGVGSTVALSGDGDTAVIGASNPYADQYGQYSGALIFAREGTHWSIQADFSRPVLDNSYFGENVAVSEDGTLALIGAPGDHVVYVYARAGAAWSEQGTIGPVPDAAAYFFGSAMALSADASEVLVGAEGLYQALGAAFVFVRSGAGWSEQAELQWPSISYYGMDVALSADGNTALIGAEAEDYQHDGAAYLFARSGTTWSLQARATDPDHHPSSSFGWRVALSRDGHTALVGADMADTAYAYAVVPSAPQSLTTSVRQGWSLIDLPLAATSPISASTVLRDVLQSSNGNLAAIDELRDNQWSQPIILTRGSAPSGADFPLLPGVGYLLYSDTGGSYTMSGIELAIQPAWALTAGWNLVGITIGGTSPISASTVLNGVLQASIGHLAAIYGLTGNRWSPSLIRNGAGLSTGTDFTLQPGQGYLLYTDTSTSSMPGTSAGAANQPQPGRSGSGALGELPPPPRAP